MDLYIILSVYYFLFVDVTKSWNLTVTGQSAAGMKEGLINEEFILTCKLKNVPGDNSKINFNHIFWKRNNMKVAKFLTNICDPEQKSDLVQKYIYSCSGNFSYELRIPEENMTDDEHNTTWECSNIHGGQSNTFVLTINEPVQNVTIVPSHVKNLDVNSTISMTCATDFSRPKANIKWYIGDKDKGSGKLIVNETSGDKFVTSSNITLTVHREDNRQSVYCVAYDEMNRYPAVNSTLAPLTVYYPPKREPRIEGYTEIAELQENQTVTLNCVLEGGNPLANLSWDCFNKTGKTENKDAEVRSTLTLRITKQMDKQLCTCMATHRVNNYKSHVVLNISIRYAKRIISSTTNEVFLNETDSVVLLCNMSSEYSNITWYRHNKDTDKNEKLKESSTQLNLHNMSCFDYGNYSCHYRSSLQASVEIFVMCKPRFLSSTNQTIDILKGGKIEIKVIFASYPRSNYTLVHHQNNTTSVITSGESNGYILDTRHFSYINSSLSITKERSDAADDGDYTVILENDIGAVNMTFQIIIRGYTRMQGSLSQPVSVIAVIVSFLLVAAVIIPVVVVISIRLKRQRKKEATSFNLTKTPATRSIVEQQKYDGSYRDNELYVPSGPEFYAVMQQNVHDENDIDKNESPNNGQCGMAHNVNSSKPVSISERKPYPIPRNVPKTKETKTN